MIYHFKCRKWMTADSWMYITPNFHVVDFPEVHNGEGYVSTDEELLQKFKNRLEEMDVLRHVDITIEKPAHDTGTK